MSLSHKEQVKSLIQKILVSRGISIEELAHLLDVPSASVYRWRKMAVVPRKKNFRALEKLAQGGPVGTDQSAPDSGQIDDLLIKQLVGPKLAMLIGGVASKENRSFPNALETLVLRGLHEMTDIDELKAQLKDQLQKLYDIEKLEHGSGETEKKT